METTEIISTSTWEQEPGWKSALEWLEQASRFQRACLASQVMVGFEFIGLRERMNREKSGHSASQKRFHDETFFFPMVKKKLGLSKATAWRWMKMAEAVKPKLDRADVDDRLRALLNTSPSKWSPNDAKLIAGAVKHITDQKTQAQFLKEIKLIQDQEADTTERKVGFPRNAVDENFSKIEWALGHCITRPEPERIKAILLRLERITGALRFLQNATGNPGAADESTINQFREMLKPA